MIFLSFSTALFADDTLVYQEISSSEDCKRFQQNLDSLSTLVKKKLGDVIQHLQEQDNQL